MNVHFMKDLRGIYMRTEIIEEIIKCTNSCAYFIETHLTMHLSKEDIEFIESFESGRYHIIASPEKSNNTLLMHLMVLWKILFKSVESNYLILTPKMTQALVYNQRFRSYYDILPDWMKLDTLTYNKRCVSLPNGNRVMFGCVSPDSICGITAHELYMHGVSFLKKELAEDFIASYFPVLTSGKTSKIFIESYPYLHTQFDDLWNSESFIKHGTRVYNYPLREGIENAI